MAAGRPKGSSIISTWLKGLSEEDRDEFLSYCKRNYHNASAIHGYLLERGCDVGLSTVYLWKGANIFPGDEAVLINTENESYTGVDPLLVANRLLAVLHKTALEYYRVIEEERTALTLNQATMGLPQVTREARAVASMIQSSNWKFDFEGTILQGAVRVVEIALMMVKDQSEEPYVRKLMEAAMLQVKEELKRATPTTNSN